jgi:brefeldin A-inhibited guanine nucleotide-exchange protein
MLGTDLHNPSVKQKMTKTDWLKMLKKTNDDRDFDQTFLFEIYDRIAVEPFKLTGEDANFLPKEFGEFSRDAHQRKERYLKEVEMVISKTKQYLRDNNKSRDKSRFTIANHIDNLKPMFKVSFDPMCSFASLLDSSTDQDIIRLSLEGVRAAIRFCCTFMMEAERVWDLTGINGI